MTHAVAIGYDWLYQTLTPSQKEVIEAGLLVKGLDTGLKALTHNPEFTVAGNLNLVTYPFEE